MLSNHKIQDVLEEVRGISKVDLAVYTEKGDLVAATQTPEMEREIIVSFGTSMADSQRMGGWHFFKVVQEEELLYVLLAKADADESYMVGQLAACQVRNLAGTYQKNFDKNEFIRNVLLGNMLLVDMHNKAQKLHIVQSKRIVFIIEVEGEKDNLLMELVKNLFATSGKDFVTEVDEKSVILVKDAKGLETEEDCVEFSKVIVDNVHSEAMVRVMVGFGNPVEFIQDLPKSYQEAKMALEVGKIFTAGKEIFAYSKLGIGRLIYQLPINLCEMFIKEVFGEMPTNCFDDETLNTVQKFFDNNLNISETARQLYIHRNTLVYRLERIQKAIGLDIRTFEDAMIFRIAMMVLSHMEHTENH